MSINGLIAKKVGMSHRYNENGKQQPVTTLVAGPCVITAVKTTEKDGYNSYQIGFGHTKPSNLKKPQAGQFKTIKQKPSVLREFDSDGQIDLEVGKKVLAEEVFQIGDTVDVTGTSKGKGFQGGVKRWNFRGGPKTHGQSDRLRAPGSIGSTTTPGRVYKGKKMAGRMGGDTKTIQGLKIVAIDTKRHEIQVSGAVPGHRDAIVIINKQK